MSTQLVNPASLYDGSPVGMSQAKIDMDTQLVFVSGQVDWDAGSQVKNGSIEGQTEGALRNLITALEAAKSSIDDVLQLRVYVRGELADHMDTIVPIVAKHLQVARPALTGIGVASLASRDTLVEIEAVAKVSKQGT